MICPKCGAQLPDDAKFCGVCGNSVIPEETASAQPQQATEETPDTPVSESPATNSYENTGSMAEEAPAGNTQQNAQDSNAYNPNPATSNGEYQQPDYNSPVSNSDGNSDKNGLIILGVVAVAAIVVIVFLFNALFGGNSWKDVIKDKVKFMNKRGTKIEAYYISQYGEICGQFNYEQDKLIAKLLDDDDWEDDTLDDIEETYENLDDYYGDDWKMDYEIKSKKALSDSKLDDAQDNWKDAIEGLEDTLDYLEDIDDPEDYNDEFDEEDLEDLIKFYEKWIKKLEKKEVKKGYKVKVKFTVEGDDEDSKSTDTVNVLKIGGDWVEDSFYFSYPYDIF